MFMHMHFSTPFVVKIAMLSSLHHSWCLPAARRMTSLHVTKKACTIKYNIRGLRHDCLCWCFKYRLWPNPKMDLTWTGCTTYYSLCTIISYWYELTPLPTETDSGVRTKVVCIRTHSVSVSWSSEVSGSVDGIWEHYKSPVLCVCEPN